MNDNSSKVLEVDINEILPNRFQPRRQFDEEEILELSDSIKEHGIIQPIVVRTIGDKYEIIAGERRYKASVLAGKETVPVIIKNLNDKDSAEIALIENIQRKNLTPIEEALSYKKILDMGYITQEQLAIKLGKSQSSIANKIRLLNLSDEVQEALLENKISERHARSLLRLKTTKMQNEMLNRIINERLTVRKADEEIDKIKDQNSENSDSDIQKIIEKGENNMNNNINQSFDIFGTNNSQSIQEMGSTPSFDIFNTSTSQVQSQSVPTNLVEEVPPIGPGLPEYVSPQPSMVEMSFDTNVVVPSIPTNPVEEVSPIGPGLPEYVSPQPSMVGMSFDTNIVVPSVPTNPVEEVSPIGPGLPEYVAPQPSMSGMLFDTNVVVPSVPTNPVEEVSPIGPGLPEYVEPQPSMSGMSFDTNVVTPSAPTTSIESSFVPSTAPIIEQPVATNQSNDLFSFEPSINISEYVDTLQPIQTSENQLEQKLPDPIIITDYNKQYDPIMPYSNEIVTPTVDFKEVINAIRECSDKIEKYGFKIDVEEFDLSNLYQVVFKIEK